MRCWMVYLIVSSKAFVMIRKPQYILCVLVLSAPHGNVDTHFLRERSKVYDLGPIERKNHGWDHFYIFSPKHQWKAEHTWNPASQIFVLGKRNQSKDLTWTFHIKFTQIQMILPLLSTFIWHLFMRFNKLSFVSILFLIRNCRRNTREIKHNRELHQISRAMRAQHPNNHIFLRARSCI